MTDLSHHRDRADCTVRALAASCGVSYEVAFKAMADAGRPTGGGANTRKMIEAAKALGFEMVELARNGWNGAKTWKTAPRKLPNGNYVIRKFRMHGRYYGSGHVAGMVDGEVHDWGKGRAFHLTNVFKVRPRWNGGGHQRDLFSPARKEAMA